MHNIFFSEKKVKQANKSSIKWGKRYLYLLCNIPNSICFRFLPRPCDVGREESARSPLQPPDRERHAPLRAPGMGARIPRWNGPVLQVGTNVITATYQLVSFLSNKYYWICFQDPLFHDRRLQVLWRLPSKHQLGLSAQPPARPTIFGGRHGVQQHRGIQLHGRAYHGSDLT